MAVFSYKALNAKGAQVKGMIDADSIRSARQKLKEQGIFPTEVVETRRKDFTHSFNIKEISFPKSKKVSTSQLSVMTRQLSTLCSAGMPVVESLKALVDQIDQASFKTIVSEVSDKVNQGSTLANAMSEYPYVFPRLYVNMISSGEASGSLDMVLERLAELLESQAALRRKLVSALTYPVLMLILCLAVIMLLLAYVVPQITAIFKEQKATLPLPTQIIITLSNFIQSYFLLIIAAIVIVVFGFKAYAKSKQGRAKIDSILLRLPLIGQLQLKTASSRLARNLGMMLASGIEMLSALGVAKNVIGNTVLEEAVKRVQDGVREGKNLSSELSKSGHFPRLLIHMVAIGEKTGQLESLLLRVANAYDSEVDALVSGITSILEPILIVFLAVVVGIILLSVMLPMLEMTSLVQT